MKKLFALLLVLVLLVAAGCASKEDLSAIQAEVEGVKSDMGAQQAELKDAKNDLAASQEELANVKAELEAAKADLATRQAELDAALETFVVHALHATVDGQNQLSLAEETTLTAQAAPEEGQVVDHWELNGEIQDGAAEDTFTFTAAGDTAVEAVLRAEKKVTTVNCKIKFLNDKDEPSGDAYEEFVFEKPYTNPVTDQEVSDGTISMQVKAEIPNGYMVDYWKINGVEYRYVYNVDSFLVKNLDEATEYEVVLKEIPVVYYKVTISGGTINGKTELYVPSGSTLTAVCNGGHSAEFVINGVQQNDRWKDPYVKQWTFTVYQDTKVICYAIIN